MEDILGKFNEQNNDLSIENYNQVSRGRIFYDFISAYAQEHIDDTEFNIKIASSSFDNLYWENEAVKYEKADHQSMADMYWEYARNLQKSLEAFEQHTGIIIIRLNCTSNYSETMQNGLMQIHDIAHRLNGEFHLMSFNDNNPNEENEYLAEATVFIQFRESPLILPSES